MYVANCILIFCKYHLFEHFQCDVTCGGGQRTRSVSCINSLTNAADDESLCPLPKPDESESCSSNPCPGMVPTLINAGFKFNDQLIVGS